MEEHGLIRPRVEQVYDYWQKRYEPLVPYDLSVFSATEREVLERVCVQWGAATRHEIVEATHQEAPWIAVEEGEEIP